MNKFKKLTIITLLMIGVKGFSQYEPLIGQIMWVPYNFEPRGWASCDGRLLSINQNQALFSLLGTQFGGNGTTNFALPDMRGRTITGNSPNYPVGTQVGLPAVTLTANQLPTHNHSLTAVKVAGDTSNPVGNRMADTKVGDPEYSDANADTTMSNAVLSVTGSTQPHNNMQPYTTLKCIIALQGIYPSRN